VSATRRVVRKRASSPSSSRAGWWACAIRRRAADARGSRRCGALLHPPLHDVAVARPRVWLRGL